MQKADITKTVISVEYTYTNAKNQLRKASFPANLQRWIQKTPEEQESYVAQHRPKAKIITFQIK